MASQLLSGGIKTLILKVVNIGVMFLVSVVLAQILGASEYGSYIFVFTLVSLLSESLFVGLRTIALRNSAIYLQDNRFGLLKGLYSRLKLFMFAGACLSAIALAVTAWFLSYKEGSINPWLFIAAAMLPFILGLNRIRDGILRGAGSVMASQVPKLVVRPVLLIVCILLAWFISRDQFDASGAMASQVAAAVFAGLLYLLLLKRRLGNKLTTEPAEYRTREWFRDLAPLSVSEAFYSLDARMGVLLAGLLLTSTDAGTYHAAFRLAELIILAHAAAIVVIEPQVARLYYTNATTELQRKITATSRLVFAVSIPIAVIMMVFGERLLALFGPEFQSAAPALAILAGSQLINTAFGYPAMLLNMTHHAREVLIGFVIGVVINLGLNLYLVPLMGITGAAWAALASLTVTQLLLMIRVRQLLKLNSSIFG